MLVRDFSPRSFRSIFKWGAPDVFYDVNDRLQAFIQEYLGVDGARASGPLHPGLEEVTTLPPPALPADLLDQVRAIVGPANVETDAYARARHAVGSTFQDLLKLRHQQVDAAPDAVVYPRGEAEVAALVALCHERRIPLFPLGGRTGVTRGGEAPRGGLCLDLARHLDRVLEVNPVDLTARVQAGMLGPAYEAHLNRLGFTCGHFPQSFEFASVGGWVAAQGAGQQSTFYGKAEDLCVALRCVTPRGVLATRPFPRASIGPDLGRMIFGSEGAFGVITEVTLRIWPHRPQAMLPITFMFKDFGAGLTALRTMLQSNLGPLGVCRLSDPEETEIALVLDGLAGGAIDRTLKTLGYQPGRRSLLIAATEGHPGAAVATSARAHAVGLRHGGLPLGPKPLHAWKKRRYHDPYLRDDLMDMGVLTDTLETAVTWSGLERLWQGVRAVVKARPRTVCMTHLSHAYSSGANLYFIMLSPMALGRELEDYREFHRDVVNAILENGGSLSHHHGVGRLFAPWLPQQLGPVGMGMLGALKGYLDPHGILNPGVLGL